MGDRKAMKTSAATTRDIGLSPPVRREAPDRDELLRAAAALATIDGLDRLSAASLADYLKIPASEIERQFSSREELEMAAIETAVLMFKQDVLWPATRAKPGLARLRVLCNAFLDHVRKPTFPGGCFFASVATELDTRPGKPRDRVLSVHRSWMRYIELCLREAKKLREVDAAADVEQLAFEIDAMLALGNVGFVFYGDARWVDQAQVGVEHVIERARARVSKS